MNPWNVGQIYEVLDSPGRAGIPVHRRYLNNAVRRVAVFLEGGNAEPGDILQTNPYQSARFNAEVTSQPSLGRNALVKTTGNERADAIAVVAPSVVSTSDLVFFHPPE